MGDNHVDTSSNYEDSSKDDRPRVTDFDIFLPWACKQYSIDIDVIVTRSTQKVYVSAAVVPKKLQQKLKQSKMKQSTMRVDLDSDDQVKSDKASSSGTLINTENAIFVETLYDNCNNLVELKFLKNRTIPQQVMKVVALSIPYQKHLISITINSGLTVEILYEISKFLPNSNITELCLDGAFLAKANYHTLLSNSNLKHLSLARCSINDIVVQTITDQLAHPQPASKVLSALNLTSNRITDVGAKYIADMLRTNRHLSYLNLAGNMLSDEGGISILDTLQKFPLDSEEAFSCRMRHVAFIKQKKDFVDQLIVELQNAKEDRLRKKTVKKGKLESPSMQHFTHTFMETADADGQILQDKAERLADIKMGMFDDHFSPDNTESKDGIMNCLGNNKLCYLNLAYNNLTYISVTKLLNVLRMQKSLNRTPIGLVRVVIEGNLMPVSCDEYREISRLLESRLYGARKQSDPVLKKKLINAASNVKSIK